MLGGVDLVVEAVCRIPIDYVQFGNLSAVEVVRRTGYGAHRGEVTVDRLEACLAEHRDWVDAWFQWSADNRGGPAWYVQADGAVYEVGRSGPGGRSDRTRHANRVEACAAYVYRELEDVARLL